MKHEKSFGVLFGAQEQELIVMESSLPLREEQEPQQVSIPEELLQEDVLPLDAIVVPKAVIENPVVQETLKPAKKSPSASKSPSKQSDFFAFLKGRSRYLKEVKVIALMFIGILSGFYFFTNAQLVFYTFQDMFSSVSAAELQRVSDTLMHHSADTKLSEVSLQDLEQRFQAIQHESFSGEKISLNMEEFINTKPANHDIEYNILPPNNRLIIPDLNINVPLVDTEAHGRVDFSNEDFDEELTKGVVKYPTTPTPGEKGNTLLFGHTSTEWWKKNAYGVVFRNIPKLKVGQRFHVVWNGQMTTYEMVERNVVLPKNVEAYYNLFAHKDESYLTLMGCYPIGTADKRMMIVAKKVA